MKQFDKQTGKLNTNALDDYILELKQKEKNKKRETGLLIVLIIIGFSGLYYIFSHAHPDSHHSIDYSDLDEISSSLVQASMRPKTTLQSSKAGLLPSHTSSEILLIKGAKEAHMPIAFIIDSYDSKASYTLHFGDGKKQKVRRRKNYHTYKFPGNYEVTLKVTFKGVTKNIYSGKINIVNNIEIAEGAEREFF